MRTRASPIMTAGPAQRGATRRTELGGRARRRTVADGMMAAATKGRFLPVRGAAIRGGRRESCRAERRERAPVCSSEAARRRREGIPARVPRARAERLLDAQQLIVLSDAFPARRRAGLDLPGPGRDGEIGDRRIVRLAGPV